MHSYRLCVRLTRTSILTHKSRLGQDIGLSFVVATHKAYTSKASCFHWPFLLAYAYFPSFTGQLIAHREAQKNEDGNDGTASVDGLSQTILVHEKFSCTSYTSIQLLPCFLSWEVLQSTIYFLTSKPFGWTLQGHSRMDLCAQCFLLYDFCGNFLYMPVRIYLASFKYTASFQYGCQQQQWRGQKPSI